MRHLVIGAGNLGYDLKNEIVRQSSDRRSVELATLSNGFDVRDREQVRAKVAQDFDVIWYAVGQGSVQQAKDDPDEARLIYHHVPKSILLFASSRTRLVFFSTDYVADENDPSNPAAITSVYSSLYSEIRAESEAMIMRINRPLTTIVRVGSLYGTHKPETTFPGRILKNFGANSELRVRLPRNLVTPTPTLWLASLLVENEKNLFSDSGTTRHHGAPLGNVSVWDWGVFVLEGIREASAFSRDEFYDEERPKISNLKSSFLGENWHWHDLWKTYFKPEYFTLPTAPQREADGEAAPNPPEASASSPSPFEEIHRGAAANLEKELADQAAREEELKRQAREASTVGEVPPGTPA